MSTLKCFAGCVGILGLASASLAQVGANCLETLMSAGNRGNNGGTIFFDLDVGANALTFTDFFVNTDASIGSDLEILVYTTAVGSTFAGNEITPGAWTQVAIAPNGISAGPDNPTHMVFDVPFVLDANTTQGVAIELFHFGTGVGHRYTNGTGANQVYSNADLRLTAGSATNGLFGPSLFNPRVFNGWLFYDGGTAGCTNPPPPPPKPLPCDAVEIVSMTVPSSQIEMDSLALGPVDVATLNAAGIPGPADLCRVEAPDNPSTAPGVYNTNSVALGNGLARVSGVITIIEGASQTAVFDGTTYDLTFNSLHTEFGFEIGDWNGPMIVDLYDGTTQLATILTTSTTLVNPLFIQLRAVAGCEGFNRATIASSNGLGNFVLTQIWTQEGTAACGGVCPCACDFDPDPACDIFDFLAFQNQFVLGDPCACLMDPDPLCDIFDFLAFQNEFVLGCR